MNILLIPVKSGHHYLWNFASETDISEVEDEEEEEEETWSDSVEQTEDEEEEEEKTPPAVDNDEDKTPVESDHEEEEEHSRSTTPLDDLNKVTEKLNQELSRNGIDFFFNPFPQGWAQGGMVGGDPPRVLLMVAPQPELF